MGLLTGTRASGRITGALAALVAAACTTLVGLPDLPDLEGKSPSAGGTTGVGGTAAAAGTKASGMGGSANASHGGAGGATPAGGSAGQSTSGGSSFGGTAGEIGTAGEAGSEVNGGSGGSAGMQGMGGSAGMGAGRSSGGAGGNGGNGGSTGGTGGDTSGTGGGGTAGYTVCEADPATMPSGCTSVPNHFPNSPVPSAHLYDLASPDLVTDLDTGLTWQRKVAMREDATCTGPVELDLEQASCYCNSLSLPGAPSGWRLPSRAELMTLIDYSAPQPGPVIDAVAFPDTPNSVFWTSSPEATRSLNWTIAFTSGGINTGGVWTDSYFVRCVRGGNAEPSPHYTLGSGSLAGTVLDNATGLRWQQDEVGLSTTEGAASVCEALAIGGRTWRLATALELFSIVDETTYSPAFDTAYFQGGTSHDVGSSTPVGATWIVAVNFDAGQSEYMQPDSMKYGRCVATEP